MFMLYESMSIFTLKLLIHCGPHDVGYGVHPLIAFEANKGTDS